MEPMGNNQAFIDGNKCICLVMPDVLLRANGYYLDVDAHEAHQFIVETTERYEYHFPLIRDWLRSNAMPIND